MNTASDNIKSYKINDDAIVISATYPNEIYFKGIVDIRMIRGSADIMGHRLTPEKAPCTAYSIRKFCVLKIVLLETGKMPKVDKSRLSDSNITESVARTLLSESSRKAHLILVTKNNKFEKSLSCINFYVRPPYIKVNTRKPLERSFFCDTSKKKNSRTYVEKEDWKMVYKAIADAASARKETPKVVLCGGKGAGKSSLLQYMVNKSLGEWPQVLVLDLDPGQSEFSVSGCLSVAVVTEPLLGPNFSHMRTDKCLYFGDISVTNSTEVYESCVKHLTNYCLSQNSRIPWFVNTMGFTTGIGIPLLGNIINFVNPTDVIQLEFHSLTRQNTNFPHHLTQDYLQTVHKKLHSLKYYKYKLHVLPAFKHKPYVEAGPQAALRRKLVTLAYFGQALDDLDKGLLGVTPRTISADKVKIITKKPTSQEIEISLTRRQKLCCINANMVAFCYAENEGGPIHCKGFGIVRGIDFDTDEIYVITPLSDDELANVEIICQSSTVQLPEEVYTRQTDHARGLIPYVADSKSAMVNLCVKKSRKRKTFSDESFYFDADEQGQSSSHADLL